MTDYSEAMAQFEVDSATPKRVKKPTPGVPIAQTKPAPINTSSTGIYQPEETGNIDGIITGDDALA